MMRWLTIGATGLAIAFTLLGAGLLLASYEWQPAHRLILARGPLLIGVCFAAVAVAYILRQTAGYYLLSRDQLDHVLAYCEPRSRVTLAVGRLEAARNRFCAAEAYVRKGQPARAVAVLDSEPGKVRGSLGGMLELMRARALMTADRADEAKPIVERLDGGELKLDRRGRKFAEVVRRQWRVEVLGQEEESDPDAQTPAEAEAEAGPEEPAATTS